MVHDSLQQPVADHRLHATCPVCDADDPAPRLALRDYQSAERFTAVTCGACGAVYLEDPPSQETIGRYYETHAGAQMHSKPGPVFTAMRDRRFAKDLAPLLARLAPGAPIADLGTGDGSVAEHLHRRGRASLGLDVYDPSGWHHPDVPYRQISFSGPGLSAADLTVDGIPARGAVMRHVLEHVHRPADVLQSLRASGVTHVLIIVPNIASRLAGPLGSNWYYWDPPRHLTFFAPDTLRRCAARAGFRVDALDTYGLDELATSAHRALLLRDGGGARRLAHALRPTGPIAGAASVLQGPVGNTVLHAVLVADDR
ncbi:MAG: class I SAM-dependent methyltransferase [Baekduia sp.]